MKKEEREFHIYSGERPKVLLLGNGFNLAYDGMSWDKLLDEIKDSSSFPLEAKRYVMPMPLKAAMLTNNNLAAKMRGIVKSSDTPEPDDEDKITWRSFTKTNPEMRQKLRRLVQSFDYVLTTNYSYEIEMALLDLDTLAPTKIARKMCFYEVEHAQTQFLVNTFNMIDNVIVWHIHGEARKPDSMIIGSAYYGKLLRRCVERIDGRTVTDAQNSRGTTSKDREYKRNFRDGKPQKIGSWIDAFILGDVSILGLGMDFSESDLWWLIDYKASNPDICGKTVYYEPKKESGYSCIASAEIICDKKDSFADASQCRDYLLSKTYRVERESFGITIHSEADYRTFYEKAVEGLTK